MKVSFLRLNSGEILEIPGNNKKKTSHLDHSCVTFGNSWGPLYRRGGMVDYLSLALNFISRPRLSTIRVLLTA